MVFIILIIALGPINRLGIIGAMDEELVLIEENMQVEKVDTIAQRIFTAGSINGVPCICVKAGVGKINATLTAEILISKYDVDAVVFTGVAGGINSHLGIGDIVISKTVLQHDYGQLWPDKFVPFDTIGFSADSLLIVVTKKAADNVRYEPIPEKVCKETGHLPQVIIGRIVTGDQFISSEEKRQYLEKTFRADCVEMEGVAVAQVCTINKVPFVIIRSLSDLANEKADIDFTAFLSYAAKNSSLIVNEMLKFLRK